MAQLSLSPVSAPSSYTPVRMDHRRIMSPGVGGGGRVGGEWHSVDPYKPGYRIHVGKGPEGPERRL